VPEETNNQEQKPSSPEAKKAGLMGKVSDILKKKKSASEQETQEDQLPDQTSELGQKDTDKIERPENQSDAGIAPETANKRVPLNSKPKSDNVENISSSKSRGPVSSSSNTDEEFQGRKPVSMESQESTGMMAKISRMVKSKKPVESEKPTELSQDQKIEPQATQKVPDEKQKPIENSGMVGKFSRMLKKKKPKPLEDELIPTSGAPPCRGDNEYFDSPHQESPNLGVGSEIEDGEKLVRATRPAYNLTPIQNLERETSLSKQLLSTYEKHGLFNEDEDVIQMNSDMDLKKTNADGGKTDPDDSSGTVSTLREYLKLKPQKFNRPPDSQEEKSKKYSKPNPFLIKAMKTICETLEKIQAIELSVSNQVEGLNPGGGAEGLKTNPVG